MELLGPILHPWNLTPVSLSSLHSFLQSFFCDNCETSSTRPWVQESPREGLYWWCSTYSFTAGNGSPTMLFEYTDGRLKNHRWHGVEPLMALSQIQAFLTSPAHTSRNAPRKSFDFTFMLLPGNTCLSIRCNALVGKNKVLWNHYLLIFIHHVGLTFCRTPFLETEPLYMIVTVPCQWQLWNQESTRD